MLVRGARFEFFTGSSIRLKTCMKRVNSVCSSDLFLRRHAFFESNSQAYLIKRIYFPLKPWFVLGFF